MSAVFPLVEIPLADGRADSVRVLTTARCICGQYLATLASMAAKQAAHPFMDRHAASCPLLKTLSERPYREALDREVAIEARVRSREAIRG